MSALLIVKENEEYNLVIRLSDANRPTTLSSNRIQVANMETSNTPISLRQISEG
jgi:hypothetical protein